MNAALPRGGPFGSFTGRPQGLRASMVALWHRFQATWASKQHGLPSNIGFSATWASKQNGKCLRSISLSIPRWNRRQGTLPRLLTMTDPHHPSDGFDAGRLGHDLVLRALRLRHPLQLQCDDPPPRRDAGFFRGAVRAALSALYSLVPVRLRLYRAHGAQRLRTNRRARCALAGLRLLSDADAKLVLRRDLPGVAGLSIRTGRRGVMVDPRARPRAGLGPTRGLTQPAFVARS